MKTEKNRGFKQSALAVLTGTALLAAALPVYADTAEMPKRGMRGQNMIESLVENGTISQSTYEAIEEYMQSYQPEARDESEFTGRKNAGTGFLTEAVSGGIIDQDTADSLEAYIQTKIESRNTTDDTTDKPENLTRPDGTSRPERGDSTDQGNRDGFLTEAVSDGIIDQDTADSIETYLQTSRESRQTTDDSTETTEKKQRTNMWDNLLSEGIITQAEYDAIAAAMPQRSAEADS